MPSHNDVAAMFRKELRRRSIPVTTIPWDSIIYTFSSQHRNFKENELVKPINSCIDLEVLKT